MQGSSTSYRRWHLAIRSIRIETEASRGVLREATPAAAVMVELYRIHGSLGAVVVAQEPSG